MDEIIKNQLYDPDNSELCEIINKINNILDFDDGGDNKEHNATIILNLLKKYIINFLQHLDCRTENEAKIHFEKKSSFLSILGMCDFCCSGLGAEIPRSFSENLFLETQKKIKCSDFKNRESTTINIILRSAWTLSPSLQIGATVFEIVRIIFSNDLLNLGTKKKILFESEPLLEQISNKFDHYSFPVINIQ